MKYKLRFPVLIIIISMLLGTLPATSTQAGDKQAPLIATLAQIKSYPCNNGTLHTGGITLVSCPGWASVESWITVPLSTWIISPEYPLVGVPFNIGIGNVAPNRPGTNVAFSFGKRDKTFMDQVAFRGLSTEIRIVPIKESYFFGWDFNGTLDYDNATMGFSHGELINYLGDDLEPIEVLSIDKIPRASSYPGNHFPVLPGAIFYTDNGTLEGGVDTVLLSAYATMSSYHAASPSTYMGEPAYRFELTTRYLAQARVTWDDYRLWERVKVDEKDVCRSGPNNAGGFDCLAPVGNWYEPGHYVTVDVFDYRWGAWEGAWEEGDSAWKNLWDITIDEVVWPDGSIHDHIPIPVYQSQPILQQP